MGAVAKGLAVIEAVERMVAVEGLGRHGDADPDYLVLVGPDAWAALADWGTGLGLSAGKSPDVRDRLLGYSLVLDPFLGGGVRLAWIVQHAQGVPNG